MAKGTNKKKPSKNKVLALSIIIAIGILGAGFIVARYIVGIQLAPLDLMLFLLTVIAVGMFITGARLKKSLSWLPINFGVGIIIFVLSKVI